jgi:hypothetical protein
VGESKPLKCHGCGSADLVLYETRHEHAEYAGGLFVNEQNHIEAAGRATYAPGELQPSLTRVKCESCGHEWHPHRQFDGIRQIPF